MQINIDARELSKIAALLEYARSRAHVGLPMKLNKYEDQFLRRVARMFRREVRDHENEERDGE